MPFVYKLNFEKFNLYLWKIEESEDVLKAGIKMNFSLKERLNCSGNLEHRKRILSIYQLLKTAGISEADLSHNSLGAPFLKSGLNISISELILLSNKEIISLIVVGATVFESNLKLNSSCLLVVVFILYGKYKFFAVIILNYIV